MLHCTQMAAGIGKCAVLQEFLRGGTPFGLVLTTDAPASWRTKGSTARRAFTRLRAPVIGRGAGAMELLFKDFWTLVRARARQFVEDFIDFAGAPKTFLASASVYTPENLARAFSFFLILYVLVSLLFVFVQPLQENENRLVLFNIAYTALFTALCLLLLQLSWRLVGARPPLRRVMLCFLYFAGIAAIVQAGFWIAVTMILTPLEQTAALMRQFDALDARDPAAADAFLQANPGLTAQFASLVLAFVVYVMVDVVWTIVVWGAFRALAGVGRLRSALAMLVFYILATLLFFFSLSFAEAFLPGANGVAG